LEKRHIINILKGVDGNRSRAADMLGISRKTLYRKLKDYSLIDNTGELTPSSLK
jgi:two-component system NtrC family response regulator